MLHKERKPRISVVIPCYNHGKYIDETVESIDRIADKNLYEIIIVNDGSTDEYTNQRLKSLAETGLYNIIYRENGGVCKARNTGFEQVRGEFILPVDSDNKITPEFVYKAIKILDEQKDVSVVYCNSILFGESSGIRIAGEFNLQRLMLNNFIDNCSVFRKSMMDDLGLHDTFKTINGIEDWEFWMRAAFNGYRFYYINEPLFEYRVVPNSGSAKLKGDRSKANSNMDYFSTKHKYFYGPQYIDSHIMDQFKPNPIGFMVKMILKAYFPKKFERLVQKGQLRKYL